MGRKKKLKTDPFGNLFDETPPPRIYSESNYTRWQRFVNWWRKLIGLRPNVYIRNPAEIMKELEDRDRKTMTNRARQYAESRKFWEAVEEEEKKIPSGEVFVVENLEELRKLYDKWLEKRRG